LRDRIPFFETVARKAHKPGSNSVRNDRPERGSERPPRMTTLQCKKLEEGHPSPLGEIKTNKKQEEARAKTAFKGGGFIIGKGKRGEYAVTWGRGDQRGGGVSA